MRLMMALTLIASISMATVHADEQVEKGEAIFQNCMACHGELAMGDEDNEAPRLAGQHGWYLTTQLKNFRAGIRGAHEDDDNGQLMRGMAAGLSDEDIESVVAYIARLTAE